MKANLNVVRVTLPPFVCNLVICFRLIKFAILVPAYFLEQIVHPM